MNSNKILSKTDKYYNDISKLVKSFEKFCDKHRKEISKMSDLDKNMFMDTMLSMYSDVEDNLSNLVDFYRNRD